MNIPLSTGIILSHSQHQPGCTEIRFLLKITLNPACRNDQDAALHKHSIPRSVLKYHHLKNARGSSHQGARHAYGEIDHGFSPFHAIPMQCKSIFTPPRNVVSHHARYQFSHGSTHANQTSKGHHQDQCSNGTDDVVALLIPWRGLNPIPY